MKSPDARSDVRSKRIDARAADVFAAICEPTRLARWWGPDGFTSTVHEFQFHPGGQWRLTLHGPDGKDYPNAYRVLNVEQDRLLEIDHPSEDHHFTLKLELLEQGASTIVSWRQVFDSVEAYRQLAGFLAQANEQVLQRLCAETLGSHGVA